jgi:sarcosine oxidase subunit alpha
VPTRTPDCAIDFEGEAVAAVAGEPIAVALFAAGTKVLSRSIKYHRPRSFFCLAGHCGACLMRVGGLPNVKACRAPAAEGVKVERQNAFPSAGLDVLAAADLFFPKGMDHHTMFTQPRAVNVLMQKVVRQVGGLGRLPDAPLGPPTLPR